VQGIYKALCYQLIISCKALITRFAFQTRYLILKLFMQKNPPVFLREDFFRGKTTEKKMRKEKYKKNNQSKISIF